MPALQLKGCAFVVVKVVRMKIKKIDRQVRAWFMLIFLVKHCVIFLSPAWPEQNNELCVCVLKNSNIESIVL